jgi:fatty acid desaturase
LLRQSQQELVTTMKIKKAQKRKHELGWKIDPEIRAEVAQLTETYLPISVGSALCNWLLLGAVLMVAPYLKGWWVLSWVVLWVIACRALRAFENLTHEASHYNWSRKHRHLNDLLADWLCGRWVGITVASYRVTHIRHHADFEGDADPCRPRFEALNFGSLDRRRRVHFALGLFHKFFPYTSAYRQPYLVNKKQLVATIVLHASAMSIGSWLVQVDFWKHWLLGVILPFAAFLPFLRLWAEASKHHYDGNDEFESTYNNSSLIDRWLIHPASDAWHLTHHFVPSIPHYKLARADEFFTRNHARYATHGKARRGLFEEPGRAWPFPQHKKDLQGASDAGHAE